MKLLSTLLVMILSWLVAGPAQASTVNQTGGGPVFGTKYFALSGEFGCVASGCNVPTNTWSGNTTANGTVVSP